MWNVFSLTDNCGFEVDHDSSCDDATSFCLLEESSVIVVTRGNDFIGRDCSVGLDAMFQTVKLPARISNLNTCLANVDGDALPTFLLQHSKAILQYQPSRRTERTRARISSISFLQTTKLYALLFIPINHI